MPGRRLASGLLALAATLTPAGVGVWPAAQAAAPTAPARRPPLTLSIDPATVDLQRGSLEVTVSRPAARVTVKVLDAEGGVLREHEQTFHDAKARAPLRVAWGPVEGAIARVEVFAYDREEYYAGVALTPWSLSIPHEEVVFASDSATIEAEQLRKLRSSLARIAEAVAKHRELGAIRLFVAGHTDTRGSAAHNDALSRRRARAIAHWFREHGLSLPIAYQGFGERLLQVHTADEVDEAKNRRVDYILSIEPPRLARGEETRWLAL